MANRTILFTIGQLQEQRKSGSLANCDIYMKSPDIKKKGVPVPGSGQWEKKDAKRVMLWRGRGFREPVELSELPEAIQEEAQLAARPTSLFPCKKKSELGEMCQATFNRKIDHDDHVIIRHTPPRKNAKATETETETETTSDSSQEQPPTE